MSSVNQEKNLTIKGLEPSDIPRFIGKGGVGMKKNVIFPSWNMYEEHIKNKSIEEQKPKLFVGVSESDGSVTATIKTGSSIMSKFAEHNLRKYIEKVTKSKEKRTDISTFTILAICPHVRTPQLIGKGGSAVNKLKNDSAEPFRDETREMAVKSFIKINPYQYESITDLCMKVRQDTTMGFMGWEPDEGDTDEYVSIKISSRMKGQEFEEFVDEIKSNLGEKIRSIVDYHSRMMSDIDQALECGESDESDVE